MNDTGCPCREPGDGKREGERNVQRRGFLSFTLRSAFVAGLAWFGSFLSLDRGAAAGASKDWCLSVPSCPECPEVAGCGAVEALAAMAPAGPRITAGDQVWQLDPDKCVKCGQCATNCVLVPSAVKCVHSYAICGYCRLCFGFFQPGTPVLDEGAENQMCPVGAINRRYVEEPYYEYSINESLCVGCAKCIKGCNTFGNGSLFLQVRHDRCLNCNECSIARDCPSRAYSKVPAASPYRLRRAQTT